MRNEALLMRGLIYLNRNPPPSGTTSLVETFPSTIPLSTRQERIISLTITALAALGAIASLTLTFLHQRHKLFPSLSRLNPSLLFPLASIACTTIAISSLTWMIGHRSQTAICAFIHEPQPPSRRTASKWLGTALVILAGLWMMRAHWYAVHGIKGPRTIGTGMAFLLGGLGVQVGLRYWEGRADRRLIAQIETVYRRITGYQSLQEIEEQLNPLLEAETLTLEQQQRKQELSFDYVAYLNRLDKETLATMFREQRRAHGEHPFTHCAPIITSEDMAPNPCWLRTLLHETSNYDSEIDELLIQGMQSNEELRRDYTLDRKHGDEFTSKAALITAYILRKSPQNPHLTSLVSVAATYAFHTFNNPDLYDGWDVMTGRDTILPLLEREGYAVSLMPGDPLKFITEEQFLKEKDLSINKKARFINIILLKNIFPSSLRGELFIKIEKGVFRLQAMSTYFSFNRGKEMISGVSGHYVYLQLDDSREGHTYDQGVAEGINLSSLSFPTTPTYNTPQSSFIVKNSNKTT